MIDICKLLEDIKTNLPDTFPSFGFEKLLWKKSLYNSYGYTFKP
jgi:hypothetical protein